MNSENVHFLIDMTILKQSTKNISLITFTQKNKLVKPFLYCLTFISAY